MMKRFFASTALALLVSTALPAMAQDSSRALSVQQTEMAEVKPGETENDIQITASLNNPAGEYRMGERVELTVRLNQAAYLTVLNVDAEGTVTVLYPNRFNRQAFVPSDTDLLMPGEGAQIVATGTPGVELIKVLATNEPLDVTDLGQFSDAGAFQSSASGTASDLASGLAERALAVQSVDDDTATAAPETETETETGTQVVTAWGEATLSLVTLSADAPETSAVPTALELTSNKPAYEVGEEILLTAKADANCQLNLLSVGPTGKVTVLTPATAEEGLALAAGETLEIGPFRAEGPGGIETVRGLCSSAGGEVVTAEASADDTGQAARDMSIIDSAPAQVAAIAEATVRFEITAE